MAAEAAVGSAEAQKESGWADRHLRIATDSYDQTIRRFIPGYGEMIARAAAEVAEARPRLVTDLGAGTGSLAEAVLAGSEAKALLIDSDEAMLERAGERLRRFRGRARFVRRDFREPLEESDAFCASLALHHIPDLREKRAFYRGIFESTSPGGAFVNADAALSTDADENRRIYDFWADHMGRSGISREQAFRHFEEWSAKDTYFTLDEELDALERAGFSAECVWRCGAAAICVGRK